MNKFILNDNTQFDIKYIIANNINRILITDKKHINTIKEIKQQTNCIITYYHLFDFDKTLLNKTYFDNLDCVDNIIFSKYDILELYKKYINKPIMKVATVITFGTFDLYHIGHENILKRSKSYGDKLIVGVSSDELNHKKGKKSHETINERISNIDKSNYADEIFIEESLELKNEYIEKYNADILIMGDDWLNKFDWVQCLTVYLPRTPNISSTMLRSRIKS